MSKRFLTALPVYNEQSHIAEVLERVRQFSTEILVVNDGSKDGTAAELARFPDVRVVTHDVNRGYGAALRSAFDYTLAQGFDHLVTIDCDGQHEPALIPQLLAALRDDVDLVSGSRYLARHSGDSVPPADRRQINQIITGLLNQELGLTLTDAFCGFKAYQARALRQFDITETGYAMPLELWVEAAAAGMTIIEFPVPLVYLEEERSFGGALDNAKFRLAHYREVLDRALRRHGPIAVPREQRADCCPAS